MSLRSLIQIASNTSRNNLQSVETLCLRFNRLSMRAMLVGGIFQRQSFLLTSKLVHFYLPSAWTGLRHFYTHYLNNRPELRLPGGNPHFVVVDNNISIRYILKHITEVYR